MSIFTPSATEARDEQPAATSAPWVWVGFLFAFAFLIGEFVVVLTGMEDSTGNLLLIAIAVCGFIYWLFCIYRFHKILREMSGNSYPISPGEAAGKHFIPIVNLIWVFQWPTEFVDYINARGRVRMMSGKLIGLFLLISFLLRFVDGAVGLACLFGVTLYLSAKLRKHMKSLQAMVLPPVPDASMFRQPQETSLTFGSGS